jgi:Xaa-Pro aminopeptidase
MTASTPLFADIYSERRETLREELADGVAVIWGSDKSEYELRGQRSNFYYLTGLDQANAALILLPEGNRLRSRGTTEERWTGEKVGPGKDAEDEMGIEKVSDISRIDSHIERFLKGETILYFDAEMSEIDSPLTKDQVWINTLREHNPFITVKDLSPIIAAHRQVKTRDEIELIAKSIDITRRGIMETMKVVGPGTFEYQVESTILYHFRYQGADGPAFDPIVGSGPNSTVLHYSRNDRLMEAGDLLVLDVGASYRNYAADITRTLPVSGQFTDEQAEIYDIVLEAQRLAIEQVQPGVLYREDIERAARTHIEEMGYGDYFIHGTSHFVGLDVHDVGDYKIPLEPGTILTVEPGIYIPEKGIGVRIEDMVLVTETGHEVLSRDIPKSRAEIEEAMRGTASTP